MHYIDFRLVLKLFLIFFDNLDSINLVQEVCKNYSQIMNSKNNDLVDEDEDESNNYDEDINLNKENFFYLFSKKSNLYETTSVINARVTHWFYLKVI